MLVQGYVYWEDVADLDLPALVDFCSASVPARRPRAVADPNQVGAAERDNRQKKSFGKTLASPSMGKNIRRGWRKDCCQIQRRFFLKFGQHIGNH